MIADPNIVIFESGIACLRSNETTSKRIGTMIPPPPTPPKIGMENVEFIYFFTVLDIKINRKQKKKGAKKGDRQLNNLPDAAIAIPKKIKTVPM